MDYNYTNETGVDNIDVSSFTYLIYNYIRATPVGEGHHKTGQLQECFT